MPTFPLGDRVAYLRRDGVAVFFYSGEVERAVQLGTFRPLILEVSGCQDTANYGLGELITPVTRSGVHLKAITAVVCVVVDVEDRSYGNGVIDDA